MKLRHLTRWVLAAALGGSALAVVPTTAQANPDGTAVIINEVYINGGSSGATYTNKFVELYNPTNAPIDLANPPLSLQYRSPTGTSAANFVAPLTGTIPAGGHYLVQGGSNATNGVAFPLPANQTSTNISPGNAGGTVFLAAGTAAINPGTPGAINPNVLDLVGYGTANVWEGAGVTSGNTVTKSLSRNATHVDNDNNASNFTALEPPQPCNNTGCPVVEPPAPPVDKTIAEIQGPGATSPMATGTLVNVTGVVTAVYKTGGFNGAYIQTEGTTGPTGTTSNGLFVFGSTFANNAAVQIGKKVTVTGPVSEFGGQTQVTSNSFTVSPDAVAPIAPEAVTFPLSEVQKEAREGMLVRPQGEYTITNNYTTNQYGEFGLAPGDKPFQNPTNVAAPGAPAAAVAAQNAADLITVDDGASVNFFTAGQNTPVPWLTNNEVRVGQGVTFDEDATMVLDYRNSTWKLQPTAQLTADSDGPVNFGPTTRAETPAPVGDGNVKIGTFNVLNYFTTTAEAWDALPGNECTYYKDRAGVNVTADECGNPRSDSGNGPRGAANEASLERQQGKIVKAIGALDADVVSLEEIENSAQFGKDRDAALQTLVAALNAEAGTDKWAAAEEPADLPALSEQDLIRTALIYQKANVEPVDDGRVLVGSGAFSNAREPYGQAFKPAGAADTSAFLVIVNHFKSKSSGTGADADQGDGQGAGNDSRKKQAADLITFADDFAEDLGTERVFLTGDFNAYDQEEPVQIIEDAGFVNVADELTDKDTYAFQGSVGSLDHVFASDAVFDSVTGADVWNINAFESVGREYSRSNYNASPLVDLDSPFRASDHDPELVAFDVPTTGSITADAPSTIRSGEQATVTVVVAGRNPTGTVTVSEGSTVLATGQLVDGRVEIPVTDLSQGSHVLTVAYAGDARNKASTDVVEISVIKAKPQLSATVAATPYGTGAKLQVTGAPGSTGAVFVFDEDGDGVGMGQLRNGTATLTLDKTIAVGTQTLSIAFAGNGSFDPGTAETSLTVTKATPTVTRAGITSKIVVKKTKAVADIRVAATGYTVTGGTVGIYQGSTLLGKATVSNGRAVVTLRPLSTLGKRNITAKYLGNAQTSAGQVVFPITVVSK